MNKEEVSLNEINYSRPGPSFSEKDTTGSFEHSRMAGIVQLEDSVAEIDKVGRILSRIESQMTRTFIQSVFKAD